MAPKTLPPAAKQAIILNWFRNSCVAHSIKDLEKALPSVASINGMQVKDYLQALSDDNKIRVEKIGSGNWYWSFPSEELKAKEAELEKAQAEHDKVHEAVEELKSRVEELGRARQDEGDGEGESREEMSSRKEELDKEVAALEKELMSYSENDPVEVERKKARVEECKKNVDAVTDRILSMEGWLRGAIGDTDAFREMKRQYYGDEYDEENEGLKEW